MKIVIIGAGLVGLATAYRINELMPEADITVIDKESGPVRHQSSHNSGVIHSGIYYKPGSLKAKNCIQGYHYLIEFCEKYQIGYKITGKLIAAVNVEEQAQLDTLYERARINGLEGVKILTQNEMREREPAIHAVQALWVPQTGIINFFDFGSKLKEVLEAKDIKFIFGESVQSIDNQNDKLIIKTSGQTIRADFSVNCAGLQSDDIARKAGAKLEHRIIPFRGEYFRLKGNAAQKINGLVYPVPNPKLPFLGVHLTRMWNGDVSAGPNAVLALKKEGYQRGEYSLKDIWNIFSYTGTWKLFYHFKNIGYSEWRKAMSLKVFTKAVQSLMPSVTESDLEPAGTGVRAQAVGKDGTLLDDFLILKTPGMIHVCNAPSPAATSCLSIGLTIAREIISQ